MPDGEVSDFRDVFDEINRLCDTMKTSYKGSAEVAVPTEETSQDDLKGESEVQFQKEPDRESCSVSQSEGTVSSDFDFVENMFSESRFVIHNEDAVSREDIAITCENEVSDLDPAITEDVFAFQEAESVLCDISEFENVFARCKPPRILTVREEVREEESIREELINEIPLERATYDPFYELISPEASFRTIEVINRGQNWSDSLASLPVESACEPVSEMYYTASSEVSLLSDTEVPLVADKPGNEDCLDGKDDAAEDRKDCVIAGHVAAMRERFESMTRTNTPCPDLMRSMSPSHDVFRNITPSPDRLG